MMDNDAGLGATFSVEVQTTSGRGFTPEEMVNVLSHYMREAIKSDRTNLFNALKSAGQNELAEQIRRV